VNNKKEAVVVVNVDVDVDVGVLVEVNTVAVAAVGAVVRSLKPAKDKQRGSGSNAQRNRRLEIRKKDRWQGSKSGAFGGP